MTLASELIDNSPSPTGAMLLTAESTPEPPSLRRNAIWIISGNSVYAATQWLQVAVIAHAGTSAEVGQYALAMGICAPVFMLLNLQLRSIQATDSARRHTFGEYLALRLATSASALPLIALIVYFSTRSSKLAILTAVMSLFKGIESISDIYQGLLQQHEHMDRIARSSILKGCLVILAFATTYLCTRSLVWAVAGICLAQSLSLYFYDMRAGYSALHGPRHFRIWGISPTLFNPQWEPARLKELAFRALPLGITMMLISLYANLPRFALERYVGSAGVGIFAAMTYLAGIGTMLVNAVGAAVCPRLSQYAHGNRSAFMLLLTKMTILAAIFGLGGIAGTVLFGKSVLRILYGEQYATQTPVLLWCMVAAALGYITSVLGYAATSLNRFREQPVAVALATAVLLGASVLLIPRYGLVGAAMSTVAASLTCLLCFVVILFRRRPLDGDNSFPVWSHK